MLKIIKYSSLLLVGSVVSMISLSFIPNNISIQEKQVIKNNNSLVQNSKSDIETINWVYPPSDATTITMQVAQSVGFHEKEIITLEDWKKYLPLATVIEGTFRENQILKSIELPESIIKIDDNSFREASNLEVVNLNGSELSVIGFDAFRGTKISSFIIPPNVHTIRQGAFSQCLFLTSVVLPPTLTSLPIGAFETTPLLEEITLPETLVSIAMNAFGFSGIKKIVIPNSVTSISVLSFSNTTNLTDITMSDSLKGNNTKKYGFTQDQWNSIKWISSLTNDLVASLGWETKTKITLNDWRAVDSNISRIDNAFIDNKILTHIEIPNYILDIGINSFQNATSLESAIFESGSQLENIGSQAFFGTNLKSIHIPKSVATISSDSFGNNLNLVNIWMGSKFKRELENFGFTKTQWDGINWIHSTTNHDVLTMEIALSLGWDTKTKITLSDWKELAPNVTTINSAFLDNKVLTHIEIPNYILDIGTNAFKNATTLSEVTFEKDSKLQFIKEEAFFNSSLESIDIPDSVISIADSAFKNTDLLKNIKISNKLKTDTNHFGFNDSQWNSIVWSSGSLNMKFIIIVASLGFIMIIQAFVMGYSAIQIKKIDV